MSTGLIDWARRHPAAAHVILSIVIASGVVAVRVLAALTDPQLLYASRTMVLAIMAEGDYVNLLTIAGHVPEQPLLAGIFVFAGSPTIAAVVLALLGIGGGWKRFLARLLPWGPDRPPGRWWAAYIWLAGGYMAGVGIFYLTTREQVDPFAFLGAGLWSVSAALLIGPFIDEGGTLEEWGWRGFTFPIMRDSLGWMSAALLLGVIHWAWHFPREVLTVMQGVDLFILVRGQTVFLVLCIMLSVVACYFVRMSGGSAIPAIIVHGGTNTLSKAMGQSAPSWGPVDLRTVLVIVAALAIIGLFAAGKLRDGRERAAIE
jgi:hypothetical protein